MSYSKFKEEIHNRLLQLEVAYSNDTQVTVRCPFCGDSVKDYTHGHFSIKVDINDDDVPLMYRCFRCNTSGILNPEVLRSLEIYDLDLASTTKRYNNRAVSIINKSLGKRNEKVKVSIFETEKTSNNIRKKRYIENRLGREFSFKELENYKVVFSLKELLINNKITSITCSNDIAHALEKDFVGFLSHKNNYIVFRDITNTHKKRFYKYSIIKDLFPDGTFYTIPSKIDLLSTEKIELHLAEGSFDILGVNIHEYFGDIDNRVFIAVTGGDFVSPINYFIKMGIIDNFDIHIYSDKDRSIHYYRKHIKKFKLWADNIYVYYNELSKDCGVPKEQIRLTKTKL